jgi:hypothetical protein
LKSPGSEGQVLTIGSDFYPVARLEFPRQQPGCRRVEQVFLNRTFERARAELWIVALARQK